MKMDEDGNGSRASHHFEIPSLVPRLILNISPSCTLKKNVILIPLMYVLYMISLWPRTYPPGFGDGLTKLMNKWKVQPRLRQKREVNLDLSDREIFTSLPLGDVWGDADLVGAYKYFRNANKSKIPNSWYKVFQDLDEEIQQASPN